MENYGNDLFLSQEGCPSLDFTLLDRPSSSAVSAPGATAPLFPGDNSFSSFDFFDGAGVESFGDRAFPGHRSYISEAHKGAMRTTSMHPGPVQRQRQGVHDFFGQDSQQQHSGSAGTWPGTTAGSGGSHVQPQYFLPGVGTTEDLSAGNMPTNDTYMGNTHGTHSEMPSGEAGVPFPSINSSKPVAGVFVDGRRFVKEAVGSSVVASQTRNQLGSAQQYPSDSQNTSSKFGNSLPINNGMLSPATNDMANPSGVYQNQYGRYGSDSLAGAATNESDFLAAQSPWKGPAQAPYEPQREGPTRGVRMTELQLLRQQALQSKQQQALLSKQQQAMRLQQQEAMRSQQQEVTRSQQQEAMRSQQQEVVRLQQQEAMRSQQQEAMSWQQQEVMRLESMRSPQQEAMRLQQEATRVQQQEAILSQQQGAAARMTQQEAMRMTQQEVMLLQQQQQEAVKLQKQEAMRAQHQEVMRTQQQEGMWSQQQDAMRTQQQDVMRTQQQGAMRTQQQDAVRSQQQDATRTQQQDATRSQQHEAMRFQQQQALRSRQQQAVWSRQEQVLESEQNQALQPQQQQAWQSQQQQAMQAQQQQALQSQLQQQALTYHQQQALQSHQQQALRSQQQHALRSQQEQILHSQQQKALRTQQQQQALQFQQQQAFQSQQQQAPPSQQQLAMQQPQNQLQEFFVAQQLNQQLEQTRPLQHTSQETCTDFTGTSYSALLHGPDTPPSQPELGGETTLSESDNHTMGFTPANTQNFVWPMDGSSYNQGLSSDPSFSGSFPLESALHPQNDGNIALVQNSGMQNMLPEYHSAGLESSSVGKPGFQADKTGNEDARMGGFGLTNESSNELRNKPQGHAKPLAQSSQHLVGQPARQNGLRNGPYQINLLSQSQQHFQGVQLSQQRSWESLEQKQDASKPSFSEAFHSLSQSVSIPERGTSQSGLEQNLSSFVTRSRISGNGANNATNGAGFKQHQMFSTAVGEVPKRLSMDGNDYQRPNSWSAMQPHPVGQEAGLYSHQIPDAKHDTWGNKAAPLATHRVQNSSSLFGPSESGAQVLLSNIQSTSVDVRVPPTKMTGSSSFSNQENFNLTQENGWKGMDRVAQTTSGLSEPDGYSQVFWKRHTSLQESVGGGLDTTSEPLNRFETGSIWNRNFQQDKPTLEAQFNMQAAPSMHDNAGQQTHETQFLGWEGASQQMQKHFIPNQVGSQHTANSVRSFSQGTATTVLSNNENGQFNSFKKSVEPQGSLMDKQRVPQQPMDPNTMNVSLAHLRHSQPSSPLSPQHVKLGLGPSNLPQNIQQAGNAGMRTSSQIDGSVRKGPMEGKTFLVAPPNGGSGYESTVGNKGDLNQGFVAPLNGILLQNNARPSSALSNSSSFSKDSAESEAFPPSSFPSALGVEGSAVSQGHLKPGVNSFCGVEHLQTNAGSFDDEPLSSLHGKSTSVSEYSRRPLHNAGNSQEKFSTGIRQANNDGGSLRVLQNQQIINMALKQLGNRAQAANLAGLLTTLKTSLSERSNNAGNREKFFPGIAESGRLAGSGAHEDGRLPGSGAQEDGRAEGNATQLMQRPQMVLREAGIQNVSNENNNYITFNQEKTSTFEASGSATTSLLSDLQRQRRQSLSLMNESRSRSLQSGGQCEGEVEFKGSSSVPSHTDTLVRGSEAPSVFSGQGQSVQKQRSMILEGSAFHQTFKEPTPNAWAASLPKSAIEAAGKSNEALLKPSDSPPIHGYLGKAGLGQQDSRAPTAKQKFKSAMEPMEIQQQSTSVSRYVNERSLQVVDSSLPGHAQLPKQGAKGVVNAVPSPCTDKSVDVVMVSDVEALHKIRMHSGNSNDQLPLSQEHKHDSSSAHGKPITPLRNSLANKHTQPVAYDDQNTHFSLGKEDSVFRVEEARPGVKGDIATSNQLPRPEVSPSNPSSHGIVAVHPKKRKKPVPLLIPWHVAATQPKSSLTSTSDAELTWANAANRLPHKDDGDVHKDNTSSSSRAKRRLRFTTQLMQQLIPPLSSRLMHGNTLVDNECATYSLARVALEDACRLATHTKREATSAQDSSENKNMPLRGQQARTWGMAKNVAVMRCVETFVERAKGLDGELSRVENSTSASELGGRIYELEKMAIVNRLARHHGTGFAINSSEICNIPDVGAGIWRPSPKKYVTPAPMPRTLPGVKCLSL